MAELVEIKPKPSGEVHVWPTREEWAEHMRAPYYDKFEDLGVSGRLADYADEAAISAAIEKLDALWRDLGRQMREMADGDDKNVIRNRRKVINLVLKDMRGGALPRRSFICEDYGVPPGILEPFFAGYDAAHKAATEQRHREIAATPIDDGAWEQELQRRVYLDDYFGQTSSAGEELRKLQKAQP